jgi:pimeloyl-ACP methyl ester carboxylesterase
MSKLEVKMPIDERSSKKKPDVIFLPGGMTPVKPSYQPLLDLIGDQIYPITKELEVYATSTPPVKYSLNLEVDGIRRVAVAAGLERFHLVGYSGGGAISVAFAAKYPERLRSLALIEPAWIGVTTAADEKDVAELNRLMTLPPDERMPAFMRWHMRPGIEPPVMRMPPGPPPAWMALRPAGIEAMSRAFNAYHLDQQRICQMKQPVYYALGSLTNRFFEREAQTLAGLFPDMRLEEYEGRSHFDPPQQAEPERLGRALLALWMRADDHPAGLA